MIWFSREYDSPEEAQEAHPAELFASDAVFRTPDGKFVQAHVRRQQWTHQETHNIAAGVLALNGYKMVSYTDPLFGWFPYAAVKA